MTQQGGTEVAAQPRIGTRTCRSVIASIVLTVSGGLLSELTEETVGELEMLGAHRGRRAGGID